MSKMVDLIDGYENNFFNILRYPGIYRHLVRSRYIAIECKDSELKGITDIIRGAKILHISPIHIGGYDDMIQVLPSIGLHGAVQSTRSSNARMGSKIS